MGVRVKWGKTSQELRMLSSVTLNSQVTKIVMNSCSQLTKLKKTILMTYDIWDTDYISDNWEPEFMTTFVTWQLRVTLDSIRNSCDVYFEGVTLLSHFWVKNRAPVRPNIQRGTGFGLLIFLGVKLWWIHFFLTSLALLEAELAPFKDCQFFMQL